MRLRLRTRPPREATIRRTRVFAYCYSHNRPAGGQFDTYCLVDALNAVGCEAYVVHEHADYHLGWFPNSTSTIGVEQFRSIHDATADVVILPEDLGPRISEFRGHKVIYDKGIFNGFYSLGMRAPHCYPYQDDSIIAILAVSEHNRKQLEVAYPGSEVFVIPSMVNTDIFRFRPLTHKEKVIAAVPKVASSVLSVFHMLSTRQRAGQNVFGDYEWTWVAGLTHQACADLLNRALLIVALSEDEGLPRTVLEAIACGCLVVSYGGGPMAEVVPRESRFEHGDLVGLISFIESAMAALNSGAGISTWAALAERSHVRVCSEHSQDAQLKVVASTWERIEAKRERSTGRLTATSLPTIGTSEGPKNASSLPD